MAEKTAETLSADVYGVVSLPPFWADRSAVWFAQAETQFQLATITRQRTKFKYMVAQLNHQQSGRGGRYNFTTRARGL